MTSPSPSNASAPRTMRTILLIAASLLALVLVALGTWGLVAANQSSSTPDTAEEASEGSQLDGVEEYDVVSEHVTTQVDYEQTPPAGGPHNPLWLNCGVYDEPIPSENAVHSMEHGAVWITYDPDLDADSLAALEQATPSTYAILSPFEGLTAEVVVSAWGRQLVLDSPDDPRLQQFVDTHRMGGVAPEIGAPCTGASDGTLPLDAVENMG